LAVPAPVTRIAVETARTVLYAVAVNDPALPEVHFGVMAGRRGPSEEVIGDVLANVLRGGSDRSPGFHAVTDAQLVDDRPVPMFGYFVGPAAQIVTRTGTGRVTAHLAAWSEDHRVLIFWFDLADVPPHSSVDGISALDGSGHELAHRLRSGRPSGPVSSGAPRPAAGARPAPARRTAP
jgi:hypothetical protein